MSYEFAARLQQAASDEEKSWILTEVYLKALAPDVAAAALAAAVPHWFDAPVLATLLETDAANAERLYHELKKLSFIEPFGDLGHNVHDLTRAGVLTHLLKERPELFKTYSQRAYQYFQAFEDPQHDVEAVYHLLAVDHIEGIQQFKAQMKAYRKARNYSAANNLLRNAQELVNLGLLQDAGAAEVERQAYYFAETLSESDKPEDRQEALKIFRLDANAAQYDDPQQFRDLLKRGKRDFLTHRLAEAQQMGDPFRQRMWLYEFGEMNLFEDQDYEAARQRYDDALALDPHDTGALVGRGETYGGLGQYDKALEDLTRALELQPEYVWALALRGDTYRMLGQYDKAIEDLTRALELQPDFAYALGSRGAMYWRLEQYARAIEDFSHAIELDPEDDWSYYERGLMYIALKQSEQTQSDFREAIRWAALEYENHPDDWRNGFNLALYHLAAGNLEEAERLYQAGMAAAPGDMLRMAANDLNDLLRLFPEHPQAQALHDRLQQRLAAITQ